MPMLGDPNIESEAESEISEPELENPMDAECAALSISKSTHVRNVSFDKFICQRTGGHGSSAIEIKTSDLQVPRAVVLGVASLEKDQSSHKLKLYRNVVQGDRCGLTKQKIMAAELANRAGVTDGPLNVHYFELIQEAMPDLYRLVIYSIIEAKAFNKIYEGPAERPEPIDVAVYDGRVMLIKSLPRFFDKRHWCEHCGSWFNNKKEHAATCTAFCPCCLGRPPCLETDKPKKCYDCYREFRSKGCFDKHKEYIVGVGEKRHKITPVCDRINERPF